MANVAPTHKEWERLRHNPAAAPKELVAEVQAWVAEHQRLWLARNRPGGLKDSVARMEKIIA